MTVIDLKQQAKPKRRATRDLAVIDKHRGAGRFFTKLVRDIESDLSGKRNLSRIESELIRAFAGAATTLQYLNVQVALGEFERDRPDGLRDHRQHNVAHRLAARIRASRSAM